MVKVPKNFHQNFFTDKPNTAKTWQIQERKPKPAWSSNPLDLITENKERKILQLVNDWPMGWHAARSQARLGRFRSRPTVQKRSVGRKRRKIKERETTAACCINDQPWWVDMPLAGVARSTTVAINARRRCKARKHLELIDYIFRCLVWEAFARHPLRTGKRTARGIERRLSVVKDEKVFKCCSRLKERLTSWRWRLDGVSPIRRSCREWPQPRHLRRLRAMMLQGSSRGKCYESLVLLTVKPSHKTQ